MLVKLERVFNQETQQEEYNISEHYQKLFDAMKEECRQHNIEGGNVEIRNLTDYYRLLDKVKEFGQHNLIRIPEEEQYFEINANTREIVVPEHFRRNGLSVQGDHTAETVFFRINRYFDDVDLSVCSGATLEPPIQPRTLLAEAEPTPAYVGACYIQWENAEGAKGVSPAYAFDVSEDDIIFGWVLSNAITSKAGNVRFSVRFAMWDKDNSAEYVYSYSTLTASCDIKPSLNLRFSSDNPGICADDVSDIMIHRPLYSGIINSSFGANPVIELDLPATLDLKGGDKLDLHASSPNNGTIEVTWYERIYQPDGSLGAVAQVIAPERLATADLGEGIHSFTCAVDKAGKYYAVVANVVTSEQSEERRVWNSDTTNIPGCALFEVLVPEGSVVKAYSDNAEGSSFEVALSPALTKETVAYQWEKKVELLEGTSSWQILEGATNSTWLPTNFEGFVRCKVTGTRNKNSIVRYSPVFEARKLPVTPRNLQIIEQGDHYICRVDGDGVKNLHYEWRYQADGGLIVSNAPEFKPDWTKLSMDKVYVECSVWQSAWDDDPVMMKVSEKASASTTISKPVPKQE